MTERMKGTDQAAKQQNELELKKQTLKDLPAEGADVKGGMRTRNTLTPPTTASTIIC